MLEMILDIIVLLNGIWGGGLEAVLGVSAVLIGIPALWLWYLPDYTAVCFHDGVKWIDLSGVWSAARGVAGNDLEQFVKQWGGQALTGRFIETRQARLPVNPVPRRYQRIVFGHRRGVYYIVGVRVFDQDLLTKFPGRLNNAPVKFEEPDENLPLR
jgi:hypothetical protein